MGLSLRVWAGCPKTPSLAVTAAVEMTKASLTASSQSSDGTKTISRTLDTPPRASHKANFMGSSIPMKSTSACSGEAAAAICASSEWDGSMNAKIDWSKTLQQRHNSNSSLTKMATTHQLLCVLTSEFLTAVPPFNIFAWAVLKRLLHAHFPKTVSDSSHDTNHPLVRSGCAAL